MKWIAMRREIPRPENCIAVRASNGADTILAQPGVANFPVGVKP